MNGYSFSPEKIDAVYEAIFKRRDVRRFLPDVVEDSTIERLLEAAHHAPSVGYMQPWNFIVIRNQGVKQAVKNSFIKANEDGAKRFSGERAELYKSLKLEGIMEAPVNICVTCDSSRTGDHVLGRNSMPEMDLYSVCCGIENLWLAARAEGLGVGWVSILEKEALKTALSIPENITVVAYLCIGVPEVFHEKPELEKAGWQERLKLEKLVYGDRWGESWKRK